MVRQLSRVPSDLAMLWHHGNLVAVAISKLRGRSPGLFIGPQAVRDHGARILRTFGWMSDTFGGGARGLMRLALLFVAIPSPYDGVLQYERS